MTFITLTSAGRAIPITLNYSHIESMAWFNDATTISMVCAADDVRYRVDETIEEIIDLIDKAEYRMRMD